MSFELKLAIEGSLVSFYEAEYRHGKRAVTLGIADTIEVGKQFARTQIRQAGMGDRLANTWRSRVYPNRANVYSMNAAASLYSNAPHIIDLYSRGGTIVPVHGRRYLAIPTRYLPQVVPALVGNQARAKSPTPLSVARHLGVRLLFRRNRHGSMWLEAGGLRLSRSKKAGRAGTAKRASDKMIAKGKALTLPLFWLVKSANVAKRLDLPAIEATMAAHLDGNVLKRWQEEIHGV